MFGVSPCDVIPYYSPAHKNSTSNCQIRNDCFHTYTFIKGLLPNTAVWKDRKLSKHRVHVERLIILMNTSSIISKNAVCIML